MSIIDSIRLLGINEGEKGKAPDDASWWKALVRTAKPHDEHNQHENLGRMRG